MADYFSELFAYDSTANRRVLNLLRDLPSIDDDVRGIFAHILASKKVWIKRLNGEDSSAVEIWPDLNWEECQSLIDENEGAYSTFLVGKTKEELEAEVRYENSKGTVFENPIRDVLSHVLIHSGYHRGQIAREVRKAGGEPINTDYITHIRRLDKQ